MRKDPPGDGTSTIRVEDLCILPDAPQGAAERPAEAGAVASADADPAELLGELGDALLVAYRLAVQDGDAMTVALLGKALLQTGRRLARGMSPAEAGIPCH